MLLERDRTPMGQSWIFHYIRFLRDYRFKLDISHNSTIDSYIKRNFTKIANRGDGFPQWRSAAGNLYCVCDI